MMLMRINGPMRAMLMCAVMLLSIIVRVTGQPRSAESNYAINSAGVVMIKTVFSANVYVNRMKMDMRRFNHLLDSIHKIDAGGAVFSPEQKLDIVLREMNNNPSKYFKTTFDYIQQAQEITATGTGFFITANGYVATNSHLIDRDNAFIRRHFILTAFQQITDANIGALEQSWATTFTEQQRSLLYNTYSSVYSRLFSMVLNGLKKNIYVVYRKDTINNNSLSITKPATIVIKGQAMPGKDVAILKIDGDSSLPTLKISSGRLPRVGQQVYVYGYPGPVTKNDYVAAASAIEPTFTTGIVSAIKNSVNGWPVIQTDANINHGSSGGPVCNSHGDVIGLTTFGSIENNGLLAAGLNFAIPVSILKEYIDSAEVVPSGSRATELFGEGVDYYDKSYFGKAKDKFKEAGKLNPGYPGLASYIADCDAAISNGLDQRPNIPLRVATGILLFFVIIIPYALLIRKRQ